MPGARVGLGNACTLLCLLVLGKRPALFVLFSRALLCGLLFGAPMSIVYSLSGGLLAFLGYAALLRVRGVSPIGLSIAGATLHNLGQVLAAMAITATPSLLLYFTPLGGIGMFCGLLTGIAVKAALPAVKQFYQEAKP